MKETFAAVFLLTTFFASLALTQTPTTTKKTPSKKTTNSTAKSTAVKSTKKGKSASKTAQHAALVSRQSGPTPERYKEIQQALADKGYLKTEPNGVWDAQSSAALAQFQNDRKLAPTGKLTSASLIALGLGPSTAPIPPVPAATASGEAAPSASSAAASSAASAPAPSPIPSPTPSN